MAKCILKGVEITAENDSDAHIIPSALGGRLKPNRILCQTANTEMDRKFDNELITAYQPFMVLVGGSPIRAESLDLSTLAIRTALNTKSLKTESKQQSQNTLRLRCLTEALKYK